MKKFIAIGLVVSLLTACSPAQEESQEIVIPDPMVKVLDLSNMPVYQIQEIGTIKPMQEVELIAQAAGTLDQISVKLGDEVAKEQVLAQIDIDEANNPARLSLENAQLQLSNAQQNKDQTLANNQDAVTRSQLRLQSLQSALDRLERNLTELDAQNKSAEESLLLQRDNLVQNVSNAETNNQKLIDQSDQSFSNLLQSTRNSLDSVFVNLESNFSQVEDVINPNNYQNLNSGNMNSGLGATNAIQRNEAINAYNIYRKQLPQDKLNYENDLPLTDSNVEFSIGKVRNSVDDMRIFLASMRSMLNNSVVNNQLSATSLAAYKTTVSSAEAIVLADLAKLDSLSQSVASFRLDESSLTAVSENNVTVAKNQLADANNAIINFYTTSDGAYKDLETQILQTQNDLLSAQADLDSARRSAQIQSGSKDLEINTLNNQVRLAQNSLEGNQVKSSIDGVLSELVVDQGDYISPGTYIGKVIQRDQVKVVFYLSEVNAKRIQLGQTFSFSLSDDPEKEFEGLISKIAPSVDPINKKVRVEGTISNDDFELKPETYVNLTLDLSQRTFDTSKIYIPMNAVIFGQNEQYAYVVRGDLSINPTTTLGKAFGTWLEPFKTHRVLTEFNALFLHPESEFEIEGDIAERQQIEIGRTFDTWVEVDEGLVASDQVIIEGQRNLPPRGDIRVDIIQ